MSTVPFRFILASGSPRRRALLEALGLHVDVVPSNAPEVDDGHDPTTLVLANARAKRDAVAPHIEGPGVIIAADTLVFLQGQVLSKPKDPAEAFSMLRRLSGNTHQVVTGIALLHLASGTRVEGFETTAVTFRTLSDNEILRFIEVVQPFDRAGGYTVDGPGSLLVARYEGCYLNVLGLPIARLDTLLREVGVNLFDHIDRHRARFL
jgi:septum formation protein